MSTFGIRLYADDALLCKVIDNDDDAVAFQTDINRMAKWAEKWKMVFNVSKCIHLEMGSLTPTHHFYLNGQIIPQGTSIKYLGVKMDWWETVQVEIYIGGKTSRCENGTVGNQPDGIMARWENV